MKLATAIQYLTLLSLGGSILFYYSKLKPELAALKAKGDELPVTRAELEQFYEDRKQEIFTKIGYVGKDQFVESVALNAKQLQIKLLD